jgi:hypothetical protein
MHRKNTVTSRYPSQTAVLLVFSDAGVTSDVLCADAVVVLRHATATVVSAHVALNENRIGVGPRLSGFVESQRR